MEALMELCDLIAENPTLFADKLAWICSRCPPPAAASSAPHRLTRSHINSLLALARFLSRSPSPSPASRAPILDFLRSSAPLRPSLWPQSFPLDSVSSCFSSLFSYLSLACSLSPDLLSFFGQTLLSAAHQLSSSDPDPAASAIVRVFLSAVIQNRLPIPPPGVERLVECLLDGIGDGMTTSSLENSGSSMSWDSKGKEVMDDGSSENAEARENGSGTLRRSSADQMATASALGSVRRFEEEAVESLEKMEIVFRLVSEVLDRGGKNV